MKSTFRGIKTRLGDDIAGICVLKKTARLMKIVNSTYIPHAGYVDWGYIDGKWQSIGKYIKYPQNRRRQRLCKCETSKRMRKKADLPRKGNYYRQIIKLSMGIVLT